MSGTGGAPTSGAGGFGPATTSTGTTNGGGGQSPGGGGGGGGVCDPALLFSGAQIAVLPYDTSFDFDDDFTFGARVRPGVDPKFAPADLEPGASVVLRRASFSADAGYFLWLVEVGDDGLMHPQAGIRRGLGGPCVVNASPVPAGQWVQMVGRYLRDDSGPDLSLYVNGVFAGEADCGGGDIPTFTGPLELGATQVDAQSYLIGAIDDVILHEGGSPPVAIAEPAACAAGFVAAFPLDGDLASVCASPALTFTLGLNPGANEPDDPALGCPP